MKIYCSSFYGCMLWDLGSEAAQQVFNSWSTAVKLTWNCPRKTRTFIVQQVLSCGFTSARTDILCRYSNFVKGLRSSASWEVCVLANLAVRDLQTTTGRNLRVVRDASGLDPLRASQAAIRQAVVEKESVDIDPADVWRIEYLCTLIRKGDEAKLVNQEHQQKDIQELICSLVI